MHRPGFRGRVHSLTGRVFRVEASDELEVLFEELQGGLEARRASRAPRSGEQLLVGPAGEYVRRIGLGQERSQYRTGGLAPKPTTRQSCPGTESEVEEGTSRLPLIPELLQCRRAPRPALNDSANKANRIGRMYPPTASRETARSRKASWSSVKLGRPCGQCIPSPAEHPKNLPGMREVEGIDGRRILALDDPASKSLMNRLAATQDRPGPRRWPGHAPRRTAGGRRTSPPRPLGCEPLLELVQDDQHLVPRGRPAPCGGRRASRPARPRERSRGSASQPLQQAGLGVVGGRLDVDRQTIRRTAGAAGPP